MKGSRAWLMLVNSVSGDNKTARMRLWRALKASGAGALRDGVYVLPNSVAARAVFQEQADAVIEAGGTAHIFSSDSENDNNSATGSRCLTAVPITLRS
jgi:DNA-binding transcriptional regulator PaaX